MSVLHPPGRPLPPWIPGPAPSPSRSAAAIAHRARSPDDGFGQSTTLNRIDRDRSPQFSRGSRLPMPGWECPWRVRRPGPPDRFRANLRYAMPSRCRRPQQSTQGVPLTRTMYPTAATRSLLDRQQTTCRPTFRSEVPVAATPVFPQQPRSHVARLDRVVATAAGAGGVTVPHGSGARGSR